MEIEKAIQYRLAEFACLRSQIDLCIRSRYEIEVQTAFGLAVYYVWALSEAKLNIEYGSLQYYLPLLFVSFQVFRWLAKIWSHLRIVSYLKDTEKYFCGPCGGWEMYLARKANSNLWGRLFEPVTGLTPMLFLFILTLLFPSISGDLMLINPPVSQK